MPRRHRPVPTLKEEVFKVNEENKALRKINAKIQGELSDKDSVCQEFYKHSEENNINIEKNKELESHLNKQNLKILELQASEIKLQNTIEDLKKARDNLTKCLDDGVAEMKDARKRYCIRKTRS